MDVIDIYHEKQPTIDFSSISPLQKSRNHYGFLIYMDLKGLIPPYYNTFLPFTPIMEEAYHFLYNTPVKAADLPRIQTIARHLSPTIFAMEEEKGELIFSFKSNFTPEIPLLATGLSFSIRQLQGSALTRFVLELNRNLTINKYVVKKLTPQKRYYEAYQLWSNFGNQAYYEFYRMVAKRRAQEFKKLYILEQKKLKTKLAQISSSSYLKTWQIKGDWKFKKFLSAKNTSRENFYMIAGENPISEYTIEFEVKDIKGRLDLLFHWHKSYDQRTQYKRITFYERKKLKGQWIHLKFKINKNRISYWYGVKHHVLHSYYKNGLLGFQLPPKCSAKIRNLKLKLEKSPTPKKERYPIIYIHCNDTVDPVEKGNKTIYFITTRNEGNKRATNLKILVKLSPKLSFISASGSKYRFDQKKNIEFGPFLLNPKQKLRCEIITKALSFGSATTHIELTFSELKGKIVVKERTHIVKE